MDEKHTARQIRPSAFVIRSPTFFILAFGLLGIVAFSYGIGPMAAALVVGNQVIDDGHHPDDAGIMAGWDDWAFAPHFIVSAVL